MREARSLSAIQAYLVKPVSERDLESAVGLALARCQQSKGLERRVMQLKEILDTRSALKRATEYLVANRNCSPREAREWIQQEARAKKAGLDRVARAILAEGAVPYRYSVPIERSL